MKILSLPVAALTASLLLLAGAVQALTIKPFTATELASAQNAGAPVALHVRADWCPTCRAQDQAFTSLKADPALDKMTLLLVNFDQEKALLKTLNVRSQSTVVVFKGKKEVARDSGSVEPAELKAVLGRAL